MERGKHSSKIYNKTISVPCGGLKDENLYSNLDYSYKDSLLSDPRIKNLLIPSNVIHKRIKNLAKMIGDDYEEESKLNVVVVLFGAYVFAADICREIFQQTGLEITTHFIRLSKYGKSIKGENFDSDQVKILLDVDNLEGENVLILEDLIDQGTTMYTLEQYLMGKKNAN